MYLALGKYLGIPVAPSIQPCMFTEFHAEMSFFQRVGNYIFSIIETKVAETMIISSTEDAVKEKYPEFSMDVGSFYTA